MRKIEHKAFVERYKQPIFAFFQRRIPDPAHAEELTQETFLAIVRAAARYEPRALFRTYLYAIAFRILRAHRRKQALRATFLGERKSAHDPAAHDGVDTALLLREAVAKLDVTDREILLLREFEELSYAEIAELLPGSQRFRSKHESWMNVDNASVNQSAVASGPRPESASGSTSVPPPNAKTSTGFAVPAADKVLHLKQSGRQPLNGRGLDAVAPSASTSPMIARSASLALLVKDFAASRAALDNILARHNAYAADLKASTLEDAPRMLVAFLRVPSHDLGPTLAELKALGRVQEETQNGEEVTQQHADLVARLKNSRETEQRLQAILAQRTGKMSDVLEVEQEIARVRGEIESMEAQQQTLEHRVEFASVNLTLTEEYRASLSIPPLSAASRLHNALVTGYRDAGETLLGIVLFFAEYGLTLVIWAAILGIPVCLLRRRYRRSLASV